MQSVSLAAIQSRMAHGSLLRAATAGAKVTCDGQATTCCQLFFRMRPAMKKMRARRSLQHSAWQMLMRLAQMQMHRAEHPMAAQSTSQHYTAVAQSPMARRLLPLALRLQKHAVVALASRLAASQWLQGAKHSLRSPTLRHPQADQVLLWHLQAAMAGGMR